MGSKDLAKAIVGMAATGDGKGYWLVASDGGIFAFGDAGFHGSARQHPPGQADRRDGRQSGRRRGYWLVASDGGIFNYGYGAKFYGLAGNTT